uniref:Uncharacterized protein n=1 Tax=Setaria viridis TaxID=4556 RepID=A0A4U6T2B6_SETVI|nr:hypothetical protein SEVIR_9G313650v2 [Setaria viridis]
MKRNLFILVQALYTLLAYSSLPIIGEVPIRLCNIMIEDTYSLYSLSWKLSMPNNCLD